MESHNDNMTNSSKASQDYVESVRSLALSSAPTWRSITITRPEKSEDCFVVTATIDSSEGTGMALYSDESPIILIEGLVSSFLNKDEQ